MVERTVRCNRVLCGVDASSCSNGANVQSLPLLGHRLLSNFPYPELDDLRYQTQRHSRIDGKLNRAFRALVPRQLVLERRDLGWSRVEPYMALKRREVHQMLEAFFTPARVWQLTPQGFHHRC